MHAALAALVKQILHNTLEHFRASFNGLRLAGFA
jgi:hypothetical protein